VTSFECCSSQTARLLQLCTAGLSDATAAVGTQLSRMTGIHSPDHGGRYVLLRELH